jgi:hypothetical protein
MRDTISCETVSRSPTVAVGHRISLSTHTVRNHTLATLAHSLSLTQSVSLY